MSLQEYLREKYGLPTRFLARKYGKHLEKKARYVNHHAFSLRCRDEKVIPVSLRVKPPLRTKRAFHIISSSVAVLDHLCEQWIHKRGFPGQIYALMKTSAIWLKRWHKKSILDWLITREPQPYEVLQLVHTTDQFVPDRSTLNQFDLWNAFTLALLDGSSLILRVHLHYYLV